MKTIPTFLMWKNLIIYIKEARGYPGTRWHINTVKVTHTDVLEIFDNCNVKVKLDLGIREFILPVSA